jgi:serine/threonine-protein kinase
VVGRYELHEEIGRGGMGAVHLGRLCGDEGFSKVVAIKRLHPQFAKDARFVRRFQHEARLAARVRHPNVVSTLDVVSEDGELLIVMEFVHGLALADLVREEAVPHDEEPTAPTRVGEPASGGATDAGGLGHPGHSPSVVPPTVASTMIRDLLLGLHAAHEATDEMGRPLGVVHRDVSPQNLIIGGDGVGRVLDFGIAKANESAEETESGVVKGKVAYMSPEQAYGTLLDRRSDIYAAGLMLWELLVGRRAFGTPNPGLAQILHTAIEPPGVLLPSLPPEIDDVVMSALEHEAEDRFATALDMAEELARAIPPASHPEVAEWVRSRVSQPLAARAKLISQIEATPASAPRPSSPSLVTAAAAPGVVPAVTGSTAASRSTLALWLGFGAVALAVVATLGYVALSGPRAVEPVAGSPGAPTLVPPRSAATDAKSSSVADSSALPLATISPPSTSEPSSSSSSTAKTPPPRRRPAPAKRPNCNPPYVIDAAGHKVYKRECF